MASKSVTMIVSDNEHPGLYQFIIREKRWGVAKRFICDAAEQALKPAENPRPIEELKDRLDEIRELLKSGVTLQSGETHSIKESEKVSSALKNLGL